MKRARINDKREKRTHAFSTKNDYSVTDGISSQTKIPMRERYAYSSEATMITCYRASTCQIEEGLDRVDCIPMKSLRSIDVQRA